MPARTVSPSSDLTPEERRCQVAAILAQGVVRHRRIAERANLGQFSKPRGTGLELCSETRLSVSHGLKTRDPECEVNDGRNA